MCYVTFRIFSWKFNSNNFLGYSWSLKYGVITNLNKVINKLWTLLVELGVAVFRSESTPPQGSTQVWIVWASNGRNATSVAWRP